MTLSEQWQAMTKTSSELQQSDTERRHLMQPLGWWGKGSAAFPEGEKVYLHRGNYLNFSSTLCDVPESGVWIEDQHVQCTKVMVVHESYWILIGTTVTVLGAIVCTPHDDLWCFLGTGVGWGGDVFAFLEVVKGWVGRGGNGLPVPFNYPKCSDIPGISNEW